MTQRSRVLLLVFSVTVCLVAPAFVFRWEVRYHPPKRLHITEHIRPDLPRAPFDVVGPLRAALERYYSGHLVSLPAPVFKKDLFDDLSISVVSPDSVEYCLDRKGQDYLDQALHGLLYFRTTLSDTSRYANGNAQRWLAQSNRWQMMLFMPPGAPGATISALTCDRYILFAPDDQRPDADA